MKLKRTSWFAFAFIIFYCTEISKNKDSVPCARMIEKNMARVTDSLFAYKYETSNAEYKSFLNSLTNTNIELYNKCMVDSSGWQPIYKIQEPAFGEYYHRHPAFADYPVVNITYEAATEYCKWLTGVYNNDPKRKFRKVIFTLPSEKEWTAASQGGRSNSIYPWGNYYLASKKGFYMCNFKEVGDSYFVRDSLGNPVIINYEGNSSLHSAEFPSDKTFYTMKVKSFTPNDFGIYNTCGNAAEMIITPGYAMGGSWNSYGGEVNTKSIKQYKCPSPEVGFRVFMKIIAS